MPDLNDWAVLGDAIGEDLRKTRDLDLLRGVVHRLRDAVASLITDRDRLQAERDAAVAALDPMVIAAEQAELEELRAEVRRLNGLRPGRLPCGHTCGYPQCDGTAPPEVAAVVNETVRAFKQHRDEARQDFAEHITPEGSS